MKKILITIAVACSFALSAQAQDRYISDSLYVPLRKGPTNQHTILHRGLKSGTQLRFISEADGWSQVETSSGKQGWVPSRYLQDKPIASVLLKQLNDEISRTKNGFGELRAELEQLRSEKQGLIQQAEDLQKANDTINKEIKEVKNISANALNISKNHQKLTKEHQLLQTDLDVIRAENERLKTDDSQRWFMYGALAVGLGVLITLIAPLFKSKKRYSEWG